MSLPKSQKIFENILLRYCHLWWHLRLGKEIVKDENQTVGFERGVQPKRAERFLKIWY